ncbi:MAG TPA: GAF domain-containing sensor histidine kinase, partial [Gemmatimonadaceae bacterium]|nr:GAF domain-containing sensor histidine kinase [Gemmatimonadaceae bacterium]
MSAAPSDDRVRKATRGRQKEHAAAVPPVEGEGAARRVAERERDAAEASRDRFAFLAEVSRHLAGSLDYETTLTTVAGMSLPYLGAWCIVDVCTGAGCAGDEGIRRLAVLHPDPAKQVLARALHERYPPHADDLLGAPRVIRTGRSEVVVEVSDAALSATARDAEHLRLLRELGIGAYIIAPMVARGRVVGAMTFVTAESGRRFGDLDVILAEDLGCRAALAVDNARLHAEALEARADAAAARVAAEAASRAKSEFLAVMSHELRTPLNAITGYVDLMELGLYGPVTPEQHASLARIQRSQRHLMGLINGVLNYSRLEAGAVHYMVQDVSVDEVLATCEALVAPQVSAKWLAMASDGCDPSCKVRADAEKLQQIVLNLVSNAVKFTEPGGRITLACTPKSNTVAITVSDNGHGIAAEQLERIFEPFVQVDARLARTHEGVGLGLAISRDLARGMGGDLTV